MSQVEQRGPAQADATPPVDALGTVTLDGDPVTTVGVPADECVSIHVTSQDDGELLDDYEDADDLDVPEPAHADDLPDPQAETKIRKPAWVTVAVDGVKKCRVSATDGDVAAVHLEQAENPVEP